MQFFRAFIISLVAVSLFMAAGGAFAKNCSCHHTTSEMKMDCHKQMAKQEKKSCCCDKAMGCKVSFNILDGGEPLAFLSSPVSYALSQQYAHSLHLIPAAQPPKA